ncbi:hypothetical protein H112_04173 [Trichophyton rubrum D6]|uniref:Uncharacterized protein n=1 Tax=Trichophyton soudanense CBS 452.61 TaxID=1215331 RepID=A0A022XV16_TRISD|nr:hypothetical protein H100_04177 [Trichophyton rubrum MR850]EZF42153.1 hypothetical protein H102_04165 [Trichophyton rubrum CBS 100081]EZF63371.1 hypothetical protein H104_04163 [Trichophyton rubrum CBS 289.86]EZF74091.1 hypothetical protein H105_04193 [Trichophyton soudanense CBS 452.61]EZF95376.1 hypothetical protein H113_04206 [Trichophyton rubrum MR1459]EZG06204.1 hypothetical protein H106_03989 [Trichophyton rubrum CBS 735.88]EZG16687.1 hypothetical protein H107_04293 [Trichophyton rub
MLTTNQAGKTGHVHLVSQFFRQQEIHVRTAGTEALLLYLSFSKSEKRRKPKKNRNQKTEQSNSKGKRKGGQKKKATSQQACGFPVRNSAGSLLPNLSNGHSRDFVPLRDGNQSRDSTGAAYLPIL